MNRTHSGILLGAVRRRLTVARFARVYFIGLLIGAAAAAVVLMVSRLLGVVPGAATLWTFAAVPVLAGALALVLRRRVSPAEAGRAVDQRGGTKDLFLTAALLESAPGEFKPLVERDAENRARALQPADVVPFPFARRLGWTALAAGLLAAGWLWLPQLDPFGEVAAAKEEDVLRQELKKSRELTRQRIAQIRQDNSESEDSKDVDLALAGLKQTFNQMQPRQPDLNFQRLDVDRRAIEDKWRKRAEKLQEFLAQKPASQEFGGSQRELLRKLQRDLQEGDADGLKKSMAEMQQDLKRLQKETDPQKREEIARELRKKLQSLNDLAREQLQSKELAASIKRALDQLEQCQCEGLSSEALQALAESLDLSQLELEQIAQSVQDLKDLEAGLNAMQLARQLNSLEMLDGGQCQGCQSMAEYQKLFEDMLSKDAFRRGMGRHGSGEGGKAPEDDTIESDFLPDKARTNVTAGKILLSLKSKGLGEAGEAREEYREAIRDVKQGVSEAILQERIPPGYTEGIKKYFDTIDAEP